MIKFFRKIRQKLLTENKFSKYLIYAIGEIILVVIGILIALQINNWNEHQKVKNTQKKYLTLLKEESISNLNSVRKTKKNVINYRLNQNKLLKLINGDKDTVTEKQLSELLFEVILNTHTFSYENSVLSELKNSGNLKNILNDSIRKHLIGIEPLVNSVRYQEEQVKGAYYESFNFIKRKGSLKTFLQKTESEESLGIVKLPESDKSNLNVLYENEFENILIHYTGMTNTLATNQYPRLENHLKEIIEKIDTELK